MTKDIGQIIKRLPGQALREERDNIFEESVNQPLMVVFAGFSVLIVEAMHVFGKIKPSLWIGIIIAMATMGYATWKILKSRAMFRTYKRGEEGERLVAQAIEQDLIPLGYTVLHDIPMSRDGRPFNIDHLLIGENGIFAIETKNIAKPKKGEARATYDGRNVLWNGRRHTKNEAVQAQANAKSASALIHELTGKKVYVCPVLCAVGWYVSSTDLYRHPVILVMEKTLKSVIPNVKAASQISEDDRSKIFLALQRYSSTRLQPPAAEEEAPRFWF